MFQYFGNIALFTARQVIYWLTAVCVLAIGYFGAIQVSYQPVITTGDWLFILFTACGIFINIGMYLSQFHRQKEINKELHEMRDQWLEFKGEMKGHTRGHKDAWMDMKAWFDERDREREKAKFNES